MADKPFQVELNNFKTMNQRDSASTMEESEHPYIVNFMPIGTSLYSVPGISADKITVGASDTQWAANTAKLQGEIVIPTVYNGFFYVAEDAGTTHATTEPVWPTTEGTTIVDNVGVNSITWRAHSLNVLRMFDVNLAGTLYKIVATTGGAIYKITYGSPWTQARIWPQGTGSIPTLPTNPKFEQWKSEALLIVDPTSGYTVYNGTQISSDNSTANKWNASYKGTSIANFNTRVWIGGSAVSSDGRTISYTAPNSPFEAGFTEVGSGSVFDSFPSLRQQITDLKASQEYLYVIGDHAVHIIHGVQLIDTGSTTFQMTDAVPGIGTPYKDTARVLSGVLYICTNYGAFAVQGMNSELLSSYMDGLFTKADFSFAPIAFFAKINNKLVYSILVRYNDPIDGNTVKGFWCLYEGRWFITYYGESYDFLTAQAIMTATDVDSYAAYGTKIVQIFTGATSMRKRLRTRSNTFGYPLNDKSITRAGIFATSTAAILDNFMARLTVIGETAKASVDITFYPQVTSWFNASGAEVTWTNALSATVSWSYPFSEMLAAASCDGRGKKIQIDFLETSANQYVLTGALVEGLISAAW